MNLRLITTSAALLLAATTFAASPPPGTHHHRATTTPAHTSPNGCGETDNGHLCIGGPSPRTGTYKISYNRWNADGEIKVKLGYEIKMIRDGRIYESKWVGSKKTRNGFAAFEKHITMGEKDCVRGKMEYGGRKFVSKWLPC
ncbi:hypothetical protein ABZ930_23185 [Streptomyces sp. NPDC046716]|uniref:hypothetical protein n=1 Tax=Streptomyces sp. NPDC046716 TaxID=3157093 RepID=UPI0033D9C1F5